MTWQLHAITKGFTGFPLPGCVVFPPWLRCRGVPGVFVAIAGERDDQILQATAVRSQAQHSSQIGVVMDPRFFLMPY